MSAVHPEAVNLKKLVWYQAAEVVLTKINCSIVSGLPWMLIMAARAQGNAAADRTNWIFRRRPVGLLVAERISTVLSR